MNRSMLLVLLLLLVIGGAIAFVLSMDSEHDLASADPPVVEDTTDTARGIEARRTTDAEETDAQEESTPAPSPAPGDAGPATGGVRGRCVTGASKAPVSGLTVRYYSPDREAVVNGTSGPDGRFMIDGLAATRRGRLMATGTDVVSLPISVVVKKGAATDVGDIVVAAQTRITGRVTAVDGDKALAGVHLSLVANQAIASIMSYDIVKILEDLFDDNTALLEATSGSDGSFEFGPIPAGEYAVLAKVDGYQTRFSKSIKTRAGAAAPRADISLTLGHRLEGAVVDDAGDGISGATVGVLPQPEGGMPEVFRSLKTRTDAGGRFEFTSLGKGKHVLLVRAEGFADNLGQDVVTGEKEVRVVLSRGLKVTGRAFDEATGDGIGGVKIMLFASGAGGGFAQATTDEAGRYVVTAPAAEGKLAVMARHPKYSVAEHSKDELNMMGGLEIDLEGRKSGEIVKDIPMVGGGAVEGRAFDADTGAALAGVKVRVFTPKRAFASGLGGGKMPSGVSGEDGRFKIEGVSAGEFILIGSHPEYVPAQDAEELEKAFQFFGADEGTSLPSLRPGQTLAEQEVAMKRGATIKGRVVDERDEAVAGARVVWQGGRMMALFFFGESEDRRLAVSDEKGAFELRGVPRIGDLTLIAEHPEYAGGATATVDPTGAKPPDVVLELRAGSVLRGVVLRPEGGPAAGVTVRVRMETQNDRWFMELRNRNRYQATTDEQGAFRVEGLRPGQVEVTAGGDDIHVEGGPLKVELSSGQESAVRIQLVRLASIAGVVVDGAGRPVPRVTVHAEAAGDDASALTQGREGWAWTGDDGSFEIDGLLPDRTYTVKAEQWEAVGSENGNEKLIQQGRPETTVEGVPTGTTGLELVLKESGGKKN